jgi:Tfp pilus assembly protein PilW
MKQDRFLIGILIGIGVLIAAALVVFFTRQNKQTYISDNTPDGVVHNYVLALLNKDYQKAYGYLADLDNKPTFDQFRQSFAVGKLNPSNAGVKIGTANITGEDASVEVDMVYTPSDPFSSGYNNAGSAQLVKQNGAWKISSMPTYNLWDYIWYQAPPKP